MSRFKNLLIKYVQGCIFEFENLPKLRISKNVKFFYKHFVSILKYWGIFKAQFFNKAPLFDEKMGFKKKRIVSHNQNK